MKKLDFQIKAVKKFAATDGYAFSANIYVNGKKAFTVINRGDGGENSYDIANQTLYNQTKDFAESLGECVTPYGSFPYTLGIFVEDLLNEYGANKQLKKWCKKETLFTLPGQKNGSYRTISHKYDAGVKAFILRKYPEATIINERFL